MENSEAKQVRIFITSLNVCGLRTKFSNGSLEALIQDFDIVCLSETKVGFLDDYLIPYGYSYIFKERNKSSKVPHGGIHGLGVLVKSHISKHISIAANVTSESVLWLNISENAFGYPFLLGAAYIPPENSKYYDDSIFDDISNDFVFLKNKFIVPFCLVGDFNARTGGCSELTTVEESINSFMPGNIDHACEELLHRSDLSQTNVCLDRNNMDKVINNHGKQLIELCK